MLKMVILHQHQQLTRVRYKKERQNQHILRNISVHKKSRDLSYFSKIIQKSPRWL